MGPPPRRRRARVSMFATSARSSRREHRRVERVALALDELERLARHASRREHERAREREERARVAADLDVADGRAHADGAEAGVVGQHVERAGRQGREERGREADRGVRLVEPPLRDERDRAVRVHEAPRLPLVLAGGHRRHRLRGASEEIRGCREVGAALGAQAEHVERARPHIGAEDGAERRLRELDGAREVAGAPRVHGLAGLLRAREEEHPGEHDPAEEDGDAGEHREDGDRGDVERAADHAAGDADDGPDDEGPERQDADQRPRPDRPPAARHEIGVHRHHRCRSRTTGAASRPPDPPPASTVASCRGAPGRAARRGLTRVDAAARAGRIKV